MLKVLSICSFLVIGAAEIGWIFFVVALICGLPILFAAMFAVGSGNTDRLVEVAVRNVKGGYSGRVASITGQARSTLTRENGQPTDSNLAQPSSVILLRARTPICASVF